MNTKTEKKPAFVPERVGGLELAKSPLILMKFYFTNESHVPRGIPQVDRGSSRTRDFAHRAAAIAAGKAELGEVGRVRGDRVDTGTQIFNNLPLTRASKLRKQLAEAGYGLVDAHWMPEVKLERQTKYVVVLGFQHGAPQTDKLTQEDLDDLDFLAFTAKYYCHCWDNSNLGKPATINFVGREPNPTVQAKYELTVRDGKIVADVVPNGSAK